MDIDPDLEKETPFNFRHQVDLRIQYHDDEIKRHYDEIQRLKSLRNVSSPLSRLSVELFSTIVEFCQGSSHKLGWIRLAQVCSHWRQVIIQRPSLWTRISLSSMEAASTMLERSGSAGVVVSWTAPPPPPLHLPLWSRGTIYLQPLRIANFVLREALSRVKSFAIYGPPLGDRRLCTDSEIQHRLLENLQPAPIPRLRKLTVLLWNSKPLQNGEERYPERDVVTFFERCAGITSLNASPLVELRISYIGSWSSPLLHSHLQRCTIEYCDVQPSMREFALALRRMSSLTKLSAGPSRGIDFKRPCLPSPNSNSTPYFDNLRSNVLHTIHLYAPLPNVVLALQHLDLYTISKISISTIRDKSSGPFTELFSQLARKYEVYSLQRPSFKHMWLTLHNYGIDFEASQLSLDFPSESTKPDPSSRERLRKSRLTLNLNWGPLCEDNGEELQSTLLDLACVCPMAEMSSLSVTINERIPATVIYQVLGRQPKLRQLELIGSILNSFIQFLTPGEDADMVNLPLLRSLRISEGRFHRSRTAWVPFQVLLHCLQRRFDKGVVLRSIDLFDSYGLQSENIDQLHPLVERVVWSSDGSMAASSSEDEWF